MTDTNSAFARYANAYIDVNTEFMVHLLLDGKIRLTDIPYPVRLNEDVLSPRSA
jgi:hypothetical protein